MKETNSKTDGEPIPCPKCGTGTGSRMQFLTRSIDFACDPCITAEEKERTRKEAEERHRRRLLVFEEIVPPKYRESDETRFPSAWEAIKDWYPTGDGKGILLAGETATCKTRMACAILRNLIVDGRFRCDFLRSTRFADAVRRQWEEPKERELLKHWRKVPVLLIDDLGKQHSTGSIQDALFELIEERSANQRPNIITANASAEELETMLSPDRGPALVRRLREDHELVISRNSNT